MCSLIPRWYSWNVFLLQATFKRSLCSSAQATGTVGRCALGRKQLWWRAFPFLPHWRTPQSGCISNTPVPLSTEKQREKTTTRKKKKKILFGLGFVCLGLGLFSCWPRKKSAVRIRLASRSQLDSRAAHGNLTTTYFPHGAKHKAVI